MTKNVVVCLDGTNNKVRAAANTNVVRMFDLLELRDPTLQTAYYDPGVGTSSSPAAWTPAARTASRLAGMAFGAGLRQNLAEAYTYLMSTYEPGDRLYVFGFSRGAYTARALTGMLEVFGVFRRGAENLVPYAVGEYAQQDRDGGRDFAILREYSRIFAKDMGTGPKDHAHVHFLGLWDTVKAAGDLWRQLHWPYTRQLPNVGTVRHAVSIDEWRRAYVEYLIDRPRAGRRFAREQDLQEVWFAGVHSDVGGMFPDGARLSDIPLKWMADAAVAAGLVVRPRAYTKAGSVADAEATGAVHRMGRPWRLLGVRPRQVPPGALVHASVQQRIEDDPQYAKKIPPSVQFVDREWRTIKKSPQPRTLGIEGGAPGRS
jgi:uncharacterized protein (DUF2235 family)